MADYIDRQAILKKIEKIRQDVQMMDDIRRASIIMNGMHLCEEAVMNQPSANVEPVRHGHWIYTPTSPLGFTCSECGKEMCRFNYCPHCGAKIDEVTQ